MSKQCDKCGKSKPLDEFYQAKTRDGLRNSCKPCVRAYSRARYAAKKEAICAQAREYREANPELIRARKAAYYKANRDAIREREGAKRKRKEALAAKSAYDRARYQENRERFLEYQREWRESNRGKHRAVRAKRKAAKRNRTPAWADIRAINAFYAACPVDLQVDHVVPLQGANVSGLHVANNLQHLGPIENQQKHNRFEPSWEILRPDLLRADGSPSRPSVGG